MKNLDNYFYQMPSVKAFDENVPPPHTHNHFMALFNFVWDYPGEPAPER